MSKNAFDLVEYIKNSTGIENYQRPKLKYFVKYLQQELGDAVLSDVEVFARLDEGWLLNSLELYIDEISPAVQTADDYIRAILALIKSICLDYELENAIVTSVTARDSLLEGAYNRIQHLRKRENQECMSDEEYEKIDEAICGVFSTPDLEEQISQSIGENQNRTYGSLVSAIVLRLVWKYGLKNDAIANLMLEDLHLDEKILVVHNISLPLDEDLISNFKLYLRCRELILSGDTRITYLFVKPNGTPCLDTTHHADNNVLFALMKSAVGHKKVGKLQYRTIIDLVRKGANVNLVSHLTDTNAETIGRICQANQEEFEAGLKSILCGSQIMAQSRNRLKKGFMRCPFCGKSKEACSENWILIQVEGEHKKYLACQECRGLDGKYRY